MAGDGVESELKLDVGAGFVLPELTEVDSGVRALPRPELRMVARYVDTADLRLLRSGVTLRHRQEREPDGSGRSEWTLKLPMPRSGPLSVRRELSWTGPDGEVPRAALSLVRVYARGAPLDTIAHLVTVRQRIDLRSGGGELLAEVADDVVSVMDGPTLVARFRQLEVELADAGSAELAGLVSARLQEAGASAGDDRPKVIRALGAPAAAKPDVTAGVLGRRSRLEDLVSWCLATCYLRLADHDSGIRLGDDAEHVHQARVATRRLRSELRFLRRDLDPDWVRSTRQELGWLAGALGAVRDADVLRERLLEAASRLPEEDQVGAGRLVEILDAQRSQAREALREAMDSPRYEALVESLAAASASPPLVGGIDGGGAPASEPDSGGPASGGDSDVGATRGGQRARDVLPGLVARPWRHLSVAVDLLDQDPPDRDAALHGVRIAAKRLRYACEAAVPVCGKGARDMGRAASELQDILGELNDAVGAVAWLRREGLASTPEVALVAGRIIAAEELHAAEGRRVWPRAWKALRSKRLRGWLEG